MRKRREKTGSREAYLVGGFYEIRDTRYEPRTSNFWPLVLVLCLFYAQVCLAADVPGDTASASVPKQRAPLFRFMMEFGAPGVGPGQFKNPSGISVSQSGDIYVADTDNDRVQRFSPRGVFLDQVGGFGRRDAQFNRPVGVAAGFGLEVYVADSRNRRLSIFTQGLRLAGIVGGEGAVRPAMELGFLGGVAVSRSGQVYVTDAEGNQVVKFTRFDRVDRGFGGIGYGGGELSRPAGLAVAEDGKVYVADQENDRVVAFDAFGGLVAVFGEEDLKTPAGVAVAPHGIVVVADTGHHRVVFFDSRRYQVIGEMGQAGDGPMAFDGPKGVAVDLDGYLYVLDSGNGRVQKFQMRWPE